MRRLAMRAVDLPESYRATRTLRGRKSFYECIAVDWPLRYDVALAGISWASSCYATHALTISYQHSRSEASRQRSTDKLCHPATQITAKLWADRFQDVHLQRHNQTASYQQ